MRPLDEPASELNASGIRVFVRLIRQIRASGVPLLLVEHDMPMIREVPDRIVVLNLVPITVGGHHRLLVRDGRRIPAAERACPREGRTWVSADAPVRAALAEAFRLLRPWRWHRLTGLVVSCPSPVRDRIGLRWALAQGDLKRPGKGERSAA
ncbi:hypothetical protein MKK88_11865 [Methylobacterium sp. E-005]|uniref:hypothetical protein n=1 Tax=Methylobacterium sp. E-005 TaxID=2836549 RepID=UPI001FBBCBC2|nr:hypothetical protein [Methylobacterium sp. E-005]MCJ2086684.1 hypothetical protein [Methylobacterium sp. E-005]